MEGSAEADALPPHAGLIPTHEINRTETVDIQDVRLLSRPGQGENSPVLEHWEPRPPTRIQSRRDERTATILPSLPGTDGADALQPGTQVPGYFRAGLVSVELG